MLCSRIPHPARIYSLFAFLFFSFLFSFGLSQDSYATSYTCSASDYDPSSYNQQYVNFCPNLPPPDLGSFYSVPYFVYDLSITAFPGQSSDLAIYFNASFFSKCED